MTVSPPLMRTGLAVHQAQLDPDRPLPVPGSEVLLSRPEDSGRFNHVADSRSSERHPGERDRILSGPKEPPFPKLW